MIVGIPRMRGLLFNEALLGTTVFLNGALCRTKVLVNTAPQGGENAYETCNLSCRSHFSKEPLIIGSFRGNWPTKMRHLMGRHHPVYRTKVSFDKALRRTKIFFNEAVCRTKNEEGEVVLFHQPIVVSCLLQKMTRLLCDKRRSRRFKKTRKDAYFAQSRLVDGCCVV